MKDVAYDLASLAHSHLSTVRILDLTSTMICEMQVSALASGLRGLGFSLGQVIVLFSHMRHFALKVPAPAQVYKWVQANLTLGVTLQCTSISSRGQ